MDGKVADSAVLYDRKNNCLINKDLFALAGLVSIAPPEKMPGCPAGIGAKTTGLHE